MDHAVDPLKINKEKNVKRLRNGLCKIDTRN